MKTFKFLQAFLLVLVLLCPKMAAQTYPIGYVPRTPCPEQGYNPNFDWTVDNYQFWLSDPLCGTTGCQVNKKAPWIDWQNNTNLATFMYHGDREYKPAYGWVLVKYDFGVQGNPIQHPYLILYNKFKGILRIFTAITEVAGVHNSAVFTLKFEDGTRYKSAALEFNSGNGYANSLSSFDNQIEEIRVPNNYSLDLPYWLYADFAIAYDPCTCNYNSNLAFDVKLITSSNLQFNLNGQLVQDISSDGQGAGGTQNMLKVANDLVNAGASYYDKVDKPVQIINTVFGDNPMTPFIKSFVPGMATAFGMLSFATGTFSDETPVQPLAFNANLKATGTLVAEFSHKEVVTKVSGSQPIGRPIIPVHYDNVMGIYNLLEKPKFGANYLGTDLTTTTIEVKLLDPIQYVLNPLAEIDLNKFDIYGAIEIETLPRSVSSFGNIESLSTNFTKVATIKAIPESDSVQLWRSTTYPLAALKDVVIKYKIHNSLQIRCFVKLTLKHKRTIVGEESEEINMNKFLGDLDFADASLFTFPNKAELQAMRDTEFIGMFYFPPIITNPMVYTIPTGTVKTIYAAGGLLIGNFVVNGGGKLRLLTGTSSPTDPNYPNLGILYPQSLVNNAGSLILEVGVPEILQEKLLPVGSKTITSFCNNAIYINRAKNFAAIKDDDIVATTVTQEDKFDGSSLNIAPNPTTTHATLHYTVGTAGQVKLVVTNSLGVVVQDVLEVAHQEKGRFEAQLKTEELAAGLYFCSLQTAEGVITQKLLVTK